MPTPDPPPPAEPAPDRERSWAAKRCLDIGLAVLGLLLLAPLLLGVALAIKLVDGDPVLFRQDRVGRFGRTFRILKFKTMRHDPAGGGPLITAAGDPRVTRLGGWLRRTKLDELPQLVNIVRGEMSFVGPRPEVPAYVRQYSAAQRAVLRLVPGLTDPASIAFIDEERRLATAADPAAFYLCEVMPTKIVANLVYARSAGLLSDLGIILATVGRIVGGSSAWARPVGKRGLRDRQSRRPRRTWQR